VFTGERVPTLAQAIAAAGRGGGLYLEIDSAP